MNFSLMDIARAAKGEATRASGAPFSSICIDTRELARGDLFIAIKGAHFDGHDFVGDALAAGAGAVVVRRGTSIPEGASAVFVDDTARALGDIAAWWRGRFDVPCVAVTGSNGKSTTKEMAAAIAASRGPVLKTEGNFNNLIGLPLTVFRWTGEHRTSILEIGMNAPGEIKRLTEIARPGIGLITNVTAAHLEKLHTVEAVARAKGELFEAMGGRGVACVNAEDPWVMEAAKLHRGDRLTFGMQNDCDVKFLNMESNGLDEMRLAVSMQGREHTAVLPVPGAHNVMNALSALTIGVALGVPDGEAVERLSSFAPMAMRLERTQLANGARMVNDSYNANPGSMRAAFRTVGAAKRAGRFVVALGDMLELGEQSAELHREVGRAAAEAGADPIYVLGDFAQEVSGGALQAGLSESSLIVCDDAEQMGRLLGQELRAGDVLLVKGSRGMRMERVVDHLKQEIGTG
ncbi:MAG: UDP-N-acetylmuramoyl-tripeptide--D-alanyl-D-alanine ligase [Proteobacteria bacterium]|nr:UDP-N-acetylmuramoyl-tripeptide--D-alanyl-D-alanine ligase [Pseudomonadota bacterium]